MLEPITNQAFADLAGVNYDQDLVIPGPIVYGITHRIKNRFEDLAKAGPCVLVTSFSDYSVTDKDAERLPKNVVLWMTTNCMTSNPRVEAIPIGFVKNEERTGIIKEVMSIDRAKQQGLLYVNFNRKIPRRPNPREGLYEKFYDYDWTTCILNRCMRDFYLDLKAHMYVLSPPGAGPDTHRAWEAMAMGSIPIVLRSKATEILEDMPCLMVDSWDEVTLDKLLAEYLPLNERFRSKAMNKLDMDYWRRRIASLVGRY